jgi:hypothetical protein
MARYVGQIFLERNGKPAASRRARVPSAAVPGRSLRDRGQACPAVLMQGGAGPGAGQAD